MHARYCYREAQWSTPCGEMGRTLLSDSADGAPASSASLAKATWRSGDAADCKSAHPGSIPGEASNPLVLNTFAAFMKTGFAINSFFTC